MIVVLVMSAKLKYVILISSPYVSKLVATMYEDRFWPIKDEDECKEMESFQ